MSASSGLGSAQAVAGPESAFKKAPRSDVWQCFVRDLTNDTATCTICKKIMSYHSDRSTTSLRRHLEGKHGYERTPRNTDTASPATSSSVPAKKISTSKVVGQSKLPSRKSVPERPEVSTTVARHQEVTRLLSRWVWLDGRPISITQDEGLCRLLLSCTPGYTLPSIADVSALIAKQHDDDVPRITELVSTVDHLAVTTNVWTSDAAERSESYATTTCHFIDQDWNLLSCVLETTHLPGTVPGVTTSDHIAGALRRFNISDSKVAAVVHGQTENVELAGVLWTWDGLGCAAHGLQNALKDALDLADVTTLLSRARHLLRHFQDSALLTAQLEEKRELLGVKVQLCGIQDADCRTHWKSTVYMLSKLVELQVPIGLVLADTADGVFDLSFSEWTAAKQLLAVVRNVDEVTRCLGGEKFTYSTLSWHWPLLAALAKFCESENASDEEELATSLKSRLADSIERRFELSKIQTGSVYALATALDPRFRDLKHLPASQHGSMRDALIESASCATTTESCVTTNHNSSSVSAPAAKRSCSTSLLDLLMGDDVDDAEDDDQAEEGSVIAEVTVYLAERASKRNSDPLAWWKLNASRFPRLAQQARKFLCIPAVTLPSERMQKFVEYSVKKTVHVMPSELVDSLVFLHENACILKHNPDPLPRALPTLVLAEPLDEVSDDRA